MQRIEAGGKRIKAIVIASGDRISSRWFLDASGSAASLLPCFFRSRAYEYGPQKVAMWDYSSVPESIEGTTLHTDTSGSQYMKWVWEIPIHADFISVGYVSPGDSIKEKRQQGLSAQDIFQDQLQRRPGLRALLPGSADHGPRTTSFPCRVFETITGPNWFAIGEAAAMSTR